jgi:hypothetical protein
MAWNIPEETLERAYRICKVALFDTASLSDATRASVGFSAIQLRSRMVAKKWYAKLAAGESIDPKECPFGDMDPIDRKTLTCELLDPLRDDETLNLWRAMYDLLHRLAVLAETRHIDSTPLLEIYATRWHKDIDDIEPLIERLKIVEVAVGVVPMSELLERSAASELLPTGQDLAIEAGISDDTFRRIRNAAGIVVKLKGAAARTRRYKQREVDALISAALGGAFTDRRGIAAKWKRWSSIKAAAKPHVSE